MNRTVRTYHVGLMARGTTAVFQFRYSVDLLSCQILEYFGERQTTKADATRRLRVARVSTLQDLQRRYPNKNFRRIVID